MISPEDLLKLYEDGDLYDLENATQQDINFWKSIVEPPQVSSFLELCCGTGRVGLELLPSLQTYHGVDLSDSFLRTFREKISKSNTEFKLYNENMQNISTGKAYNIVAIPFNSLSHLYTFEDITNTLLNVKKHMDSESHFVFDVHNPSLEILLRCPTKESVAKTFVDSSAKQEITVYESNKYDRATQINHISWRYVTKEGHELKRLKLPMRVFFPSEIDNILQYNGFSIMDKFGNFERQSYESSSPKQIFVCKR